MTTNQLALFFHHHIKDSIESPKRAFAHHIRWIVAGVLVIALLMYPLVRRVVTESTVAPAASPAAATALPDLLALSLQYYQAKRYREAVEVSKAFLEINPRSADAYNNLGVSYAGLGQWGQAIASLEVALRISPDYNLAKNNLVWVRTEMRKIPPPEKSAASLRNQLARP